MLEVQLIGNLGQDPEMRYTPEGEGITSFSVACSQGKDKEGNDRPPTWVRVDAWGKLAELTNEYLGKGSQVFIRGRLRVDEWTDKSGEKRFSIKVTADQVQFLGGRSGENSSSNPEAVGADAHG